MPPVADDNKAAWDSNDYVRVTINVLLITGAIFLIKVAVQMIYLLYLRKRHPNDGARPRTRVGLVFDPTSPDMIPNLEIGMERRDTHGGTQPQGEVRNDEEPPSAPADLADPRGEASNAGGVEPISGQECCEVPAALRRSATA
ncbi:MAG: hypothetical protein LQ342_007215 [Letrouitia transgressa]|nr:MAG: hypothetical protein LQ342_007215 [Letrouitia transgressa]